MVVATAQGYYAAIAGVIPVLLLVLAVGDDRVLKLRRRPGESMAPLVFVSFFALLVMIGGEVAALRAIADGHGSQFARNLTAIAFGFAFALIVARFIRVLITDDDADRVLTDGQVRLVASASVVVILVTVAVLVDWG